MVEPQCGSSDMTQSTAANEMRQRVQHQPQAAQSLEARLNAARQRAVLQVAALVENVGQANPDGEVDDPARKPAAQSAGVQLPAIVRGQRRIAHPLIKMMASKQDRQEQHKHQRQAFAGRFQHAADRQAPQAAGKILHHQQRQASQTEAEPEHVSDQVAAQELVAAKAPHRRCRRRLR